MKEWRILKTGIMKKCVRVLKFIQIISLTIREPRKGCTKRSIEEVNEMLKLHELEI